jgi:hypothetical protein
LTAVRRPTMAAQCDAREGDNAREGGGTSKGRWARYVTRVREAERGRKVTGTGK